eukprot:213265-Rhodomonas_salina.3
MGHREQKSGANISAKGLSYLPSCHQEQNRANQTPNNGKRVTTHNSEVHEVDDQKNECTSKGTKSGPLL